MRRALLASVCACAFGLGGCANFANNVHQFSTGYQSVVADINADIAATAPDVAVACANLQTAGMLVAPFVPANTKAQATLAAVNTGIATYCQAIPTNIPSVLAQVTAAVKAAQVAYNQITKGGS
jgi:hypothetical protein